jgi:hypothetical protein
MGCIMSFNINDRVSIHIDGHHILTGRTGQIGGIHSYAEFNNLLLKLDEPLESGLWIIMIPEFYVNKIGDKT